MGMRIEIPERCTTGLLVTAKVQKRRLSFDPWGGYGLAWLVSGGEVPPEDILQIEAIERTC
jgi:hypothetical protein